MGVISIITDVDILHPRQRQIVELLREGHSRRWVSDELGISVGTIQNTLTAAIKLTREGTGRKRNHFIDELDEETPREARARVARDLAEGRRCTHKMLSGAPCSLLLPCAGHQR